MSKITNIKEGQDYLYNNCTNYEVEDFNVDSNKCFIFFSSNGIYEDTFEKFYKAMIEGNRYEWKSIAEVIKKRKKVSRIIYIRDVYKNWYVHGINKEQDSIRKVLKVLRKLTEGYKVTTIGISSGGYMATVAGVELDAERVFCISGQFEIGSCMRDRDKVLELEDKWVNLVEVIKSKEKAQIYYFCPIRCEFDKKNYELVKDFGNVKTFLFDSNLHADTVYPFNFPDIFLQSEKKWNKMSKKYSKKIIKKNSFLFSSITITGIREFVERAIKMRLRLARIKEVWDVK